MNASELKDLAIEALDDMKARDISCLEVSGITTIADYMVVATGTSTRHVKSLSEEVEKQVKEAGGDVVGVGQSHRRCNEMQNSCFPNRPLSTMAKAHQPKANNAYARTSSLVLMADAIPRRASLMARVAKVQLRKLEEGPCRSALLW